MRTALIFLPLLMAGTAPAGVKPLPWVHAEYRASKLFMTIRLTLDMELLSGDAVLAATPEAFQGEGRQLLGEQAVLVALQSSRSGQTKETRLYLDPVDGAALRREQREYSDSPDFKDLRYTATGIARTRAEPLDGEADQPPSAWGQVRRQFRAFPDPADDQVVADISALPFLVAMQAWRGPADTFQFLAFEDDQLVRITATAVRWNSTRVDYQTDTGTIDGKQRLLEVRVIALGDHGQPADIDLFGLASDVLLLVDTKIGVPAEIRGSVPFLGEVRFALTRVRQGPASR